MALDLSAFNLHTKETGAFMLQLSDEHFMSSLYWPVYRTPSPQKNRRRKKGESVLGSITSRCSAGGIKDRTLETAEIEPRSVHRLSFYIPHKQLNLNITGKNVKFCFVSILFL